ncbi:hypothetical protein [Streptomyces hydrogenans]|uniref:hypothetical protein n=1 Tax=Streptomyces hydrogenans TaxID=1873719 RepID=UPI00342B4A80
MNDALTRACLTCVGRTTWWVEIAPTLPDGETVDVDAAPFLGIDTQIPGPAQLYEAHKAANRLLREAGWQSKDLGFKAASQEWPIERIPPGPDGTQTPAVPEGEDGYLCRAGAVWLSRTPRITRRPSPVYLTAAAAWRLVFRGYDVALPEGYDLDALDRIMAWTISSSTEHVTLDERKAREIGEIARDLADHHAELLEVGDHGDEAWGVAGVLRALATGHSTPGATPLDGPDTMPGSVDPWGDETPVDEQLDDPLPEAGTALQDVTLWFPKRWQDDCEVEWTGDGDIPWSFRQVPVAGDHLNWQGAHGFEVVAVMHSVADYSEQRIHVHLDVATDDDRERLRALGGLCLRDQLILARASGTSWGELASEHEILPSTLLRYVREQKELADRDLDAEVIEGGAYGVDISGLDRAAVLAALWNNVYPNGWGGDEVLTVDEAKAALADQGGRISTLRGRVLQVVLTGDRFNGWLYDQQSLTYDDGFVGHVTAAGVVAHLRATGSTTGAPRVAK